MRKGKDICRLYVSYMLAICWLYVSYMLGIAKVNDGFLLFILQLKLT